MSIKPSSKHGHLPVVLILVVLVLDIHRRRHNKEKFIYVHNFNIIFGDLPLIQVNKALTLLKLLLFRIFLEQRRYPQNGEISSQVSPPQQLCLIPTSVLLGQISKAKLECAAYRSVPIKFRNCSENINRQKSFHVLSCLCELWTHDLLQITRETGSRKSNS